MAKAKIPHLFYAALISTILVSKFTESVPEGALVTQFPGFNGTFPSKHYSGYLSIHSRIPFSGFYCKWSFSAVMVPYPFVTFTATAFLFTWGS